MKNKWSRRKLLERKLERGKTHDKKWEDSEIRISEKVRSDKLQAM
jgi:hypothetical protein